MNKRELEDFMRINEENARKTLEKPESIWATLGGAVLLVATALMLIFAAGWAAGQ